MRTLQELYSVGNTPSVAEALVLLPDLTAPGARFNVEFTIASAFEAAFRPSGLSNWSLEFKNASITIGGPGAFSCVITRAVTAFVYQVTLVYDWFDPTCTAGLVKPTPEVVEVTRVLITGLSSFKDMLSDMLRLWRLMFISRAFYNRGATILRTPELVTDGPVLRFFGSLPGPATGVIYTARLGVIDYSYRVQDDRVIGSPLSVNYYVPLMLTPDFPALLDSELNAMRTAGSQLFAARAALATVLGAPSAEPECVRDL